jgi:hypothetical protein
MRRKFFKQNKGIKNIGLTKKLKKMHESLTGGEAMTQDFPVHASSEIADAYSDALATVLSDVATHSGYFSNIRKELTDTSNNGINQIPSNLQASAQNTKSILVGLDYTVPFIVKYNVAVKFNATQGEKIKEALRIKALEILATSRGKSSDATKLSTAYDTRITAYLAA